MLLEQIFEEEDNDYVDNRVVVNKWRAIENCLKKANITDEKTKEEFFQNVDWCWDGCAERLEKLGWTILRGKELI